MDQAELDAKIRRNCEILMEEHGQRLSIASKRCINAKGEPIPWYTYPAIEYFQQFDFSQCDIFEFGCGNSTLFWANRAASVTAVEHDPEWCAAMTAQIPDNAKILLRPERDGYVAALTERTARPDVVVIDGRWRLDCARAVLPLLPENGLIIFDNSDWYDEAPQTLVNAGFLQIDFNGFGPINNYCWTTSLFVRAVRPKARMVRKPTPVGGQEVHLDYND